jgi:hypothetical protein
MSLSVCCGLRCRILCTVSMLRSTLSNSLHCCRVALLHTWSQHDFDRPQWDIVNFELVGYVMPVNSSTQYSVLNHVMHIASEPATTICYSDYGLPIKQTLSSSWCGTLHRFQVWAKLSFLASDVGNGSSQMSSFLASTPSRRFSVIYCILILIRGLSRLLLLMSKPNYPVSPKPNLEHSASSTFPLAPSSTVPRSPHKLHPVFQLFGNIVPFHSSIVDRLDCTA